jgi:hypothetical protein
MTEQPQQPQQPQQMHGLPYWELRFDANGDPDGDQRSALLAQLPASGVTDLFVFSHGWNNRPDVARRLYDRFYGLLADAATQHAGPDASLGLVGLIWPSMRWPDESIPDFAPAAAGLADMGQEQEQTFTDLKEQFSAPEQQAALTRMDELLRTRPADEARLEEFQQLMKSLGEGSTGAEEDAGENSLVEDPPEEAFGKFLPALASAGMPSGLTPASPDAGGAAALGDIGGAGAGVVSDAGGAAGLNLGRLWQGAKEALRSFTYFQMKKRAGTVGVQGLGPLLGTIAQQAPGVRVHLIGHSFGARLVSFALAGLPDGDATPVKSLLLIEGAFSHFAFAQRLPFRDGAGALAGRDRRVDGPLVVVHSEHDSAVCVLYPIASRASGEDAAGLTDALFRWGAMGADGAQAVDAASDAVKAAGTAYALATGRFTNVDASTVVKTGGPPSGAHSDIFHPELAWLALSAAGLAAR